jgi:hypothetical protein
MPPKDSALPTLISDEAETHRFGAFSSISHQIDVTKLLVWD